MKRFMKCDTCGERIIIKLNLKSIYGSGIKCKHCGKKNKIDNNKSAKRPYLRGVITFFMITITSTVASLLVTYNKNVPLFPWYVSLAIWISVAITLIPLAIFLEMLCYEKVPDDSEE